MPCDSHSPATLDASEPTSATLHTRLRAPAPRGFPAQSQGCLFPALTWGTWRFTTPCPLRRAYRLSFMGGVVFPGRVCVPRFHEPICRASDIPVAFPQPRCGSLIAPTLRNCRRFWIPCVRDLHTMSTTRDAFCRWGIAARFPAAIPRRCRDFAIATRWNDAGSLTAVSTTLSRRRLATIC